MKQIPKNITEAIKVQFLIPIFEDDFVETGMKAWLTKIEKEDDMFNLFFDFTDFEQENDKYLTETFYMYGKDGKELGTAKEAGWYKNKYSVYFCTSDNACNEDTFNADISKYLKVID